MNLCVDISVVDPQWETLCLDCEDLARSAIDAVFRQSDTGQSILSKAVEPEISIVLANDSLVQTLNRDYRDKDKPTNVLSFAMLDTENGWQSPQAPGPCALGDLVLAWETIHAESEAEGKPFSEHFFHLIVHGALHLLGYDHIEDKEAETMEFIEIQILNTFGYKNPYQNR